MSTDANQIKPPAQRAARGQPDEPPQATQVTAGESDTPQSALQPARAAANPAELESTVGAASARSSARGWVSRTVPTLLVIGALAALGYLGHHFGWKVPKFSAIVGENEPPGVKWCEEHGVPEAECVSCNAELMPKGQLYGWCREHGVHECLLHHPQLAQLAESPTVTQADLDRAARAIALRPRAANDPTCKMHLRRIQFATSEAADKAGIEIGLVDRGPVIEAVSATGEVIYDPTRVTRLAARAAGTIWRVDKKIGNRVKTGDVLALVDAAQVGQAKAELLQAMAQFRLHDQNLDRLVRLEGVVAGKRVLEAKAARMESEAAVRKSVQTLQNLGLPVDLKSVYQQPTAELSESLQSLGLPRSVVESLDARTMTGNLIPVVAPRDGIVVDRNVVAGEVVDTSRTLFTVADTSQMWLVLNVPLEDAKYVNIGQKVMFRPDGADRADSGTLTWMSTEVDKATRTVEVRGEAPNLDGHLRNETFGTGQIVLREESDAIVVPSSAVHWEGCCHIAFVRDRDYLKPGSYKVFHTRSVRPGVANEDKTEVIAGLWPGEVVVTDGSGVLRAELLKGNLGAG